MVISIIYNNGCKSKHMSNNLQTNLGYLIMTIYDTFLLCHLVDIFFHKSHGSERVKEIQKKYQ